MDNAQTQSKTFAERLLSVPKPVLFLLLFLATSVPLFFKVRIPNTTLPSSRALYQELMKLPEGSTVMVQSDWTQSTQGESLGQFQALMRILMRRNIKFAILSVADNQAPEVARDAIIKLNQERIKNNEKPYQPWIDYVQLGYFPGAEGLGQNIRNNIRNAFKGRTDKNPQGDKEDVFHSPVLQNINVVGNLSAFIVVTGTKSITIALERLSKNVMMLGMVTGVMGPETNNYFESGQLKGLSAGLKGVYDIESLMQDGDKEAGVPGFTQQPNLDRGARFQLALTAAIGLLVLAVVAGNLGLLLSKRGGKS